MSPLSILLVGMLIMGAVLFIASMIVAAAPLIATCVVMGGLMWILVLLFDPPDEPDNAKPKDKTKPP